MEKREVEGVRLIEFLYYLVQYVRVEVLHEDLQDLFQHLGLRHVGLLVELNQLLQLFEVCFQRKELGEEKGALDEFVGGVASEEEVYDVEVEEGLDYEFLQLGFYLLLSIGIQVLNALEFLRVLQVPQKENDDLDFHGLERNSVKILFFEGVFVRILIVDELLDFLQDHPLTILILQSSQVLVGNSIKYWP